MPNLNLTAYLGIALMVALCAWTIDHSMASTRYARLERNIADKRSKTLEDALITQTKLNDLAANLDQKLSEAKAKNVQFENERDAAIAAGSKRVLVRAKCPSVSENASATGGANGSATELDPVYRSTLSTLRHDAHRAAEQINGLQAYARACTSMNTGKQK